MRCEKQLFAVYLVSAAGKHKNLGDWCVCFGIYSVDNHRNQKKKCQLYPRGYKPNGV